MGRLRRFRPALHVLHRYLDRARRGDHLHRFALLLRERRPQTFVPVHNRPHRALQRLHIQHAAQAQRARHVVFRTGPF